MPDPAFPDALPALSRLHWYVLERVLGQGGFGITYLAKDTNLDQRVAIKEYLPVEVATRLPDSTVRPRTEELRDRYRWGLERFIQEARTLARFDHPNIVRVLSVFEFNCTAYMVMRFEEGGTLSALLDRRGTLPEAELMRVLLPILDGLELVHNAGFIHRDIKPDNIHIGGDGRPVLLDFGSARQSLGSSNTLTILIAPGYAPFEQYYSDPSAQGPWTDIYGLGATCYRAICGRAPLDAVSRSKSILGSTQEVMVPASVVGAGRYSGRLLAAIDHALAFAEKDRPQTIAEWRGELVGERAAAPAIAVPSEPLRTPAPRATAAQAVTLTSSAIASTQREDGATQARAPARATAAARLQFSGLWKWALGSVAIAAVAVAFYVFQKLAALEDQIASEKQTREKQAEPERQAPKPQQPGAEAPPKAAEEKVPSEPAQKPEMAQPQPELQRKSPEKNAPPTKPPSAPPRATPPRGTTPAPAPKPEEKEPSVQPPVIASPAPVPEPPKPARPTPAEQLAEAERAISTQRYDEAIKLLAPLSEAGNAQAQVRLADAYAAGHGVERDPKRAAQLYEKAALQGDTGAQLKLGDAYADGNGVLQSTYLAYVWYGTATRLGSTSAKAKRDKAATGLQPAELKQADLLIESIIERTRKQS